MTDSDQNVGRMRSPVVVLAACPYNFDDYVTRQDMAVDDIGLGYLYAALTANGYSVVMLDSLRSKNPFISPYHKLEEAILAAKPSYVGFSDSSVVFEKSLQLSKRLKEKIAGLTIIYGDMHASMFREEILKAEPHVDFIICGDGDRSLPCLIDALEEKTDYSNIPGLTYRFNGEIKSNPPDLSVDFETLPFPYRPSLKDSAQNSHLFFNLITSKGCNGHCTYCSISSYLTKYCSGNAQRWRSRSIQNIVEEISFLYDRRVRNFFFCDDNLIGDRESGITRITELCDLIIGKKFKDVTFTASVRPDSLLPSDIDVILKMKRAGFHMLSMGLEASNEKQLRLYGKSYNIDLARELITTLFEHHIMVRVGYIMFFPYSTFEMLQQNADFLSDAGLAYMFPCYYSMLLPISAISLERKLKKDNLVERDTSFLKPGIFRYQDSRVENFQKFMEGAMFRQHPYIYSILKTGFEIAKNSDIENGAVHSLYMKSLDCIAKASSGFFKTALAYYEQNGSHESANLELYASKKQWRETIKQQVAFQEELQVQI